MVLLDEIEVVLVAMNLLRLPLLVSHQPGIIIFIKAHMSTSLPFIVINLMSSHSIFDQKTALKQEHERLTQEDTVRRKQFSDQVQARKASIQDLEN